MKKTIKIAAIVAIAAVAGIAVYNAQSDESTSTKTSNGDAVSIDYQDALKKPLSDIPDSILGAPHYVLVKDSANEFMCKQFDKVKYTGNKFFILDRQLRSLIVRDRWGNVVCKVGNRGNGPEEYLGIVDFDVDSKGNIYCIDGQLDKLFIYDSEFKVDKILKLPFETDIIQVLDNGDMLFGLSSWNKKEGAGYKIALTDKDLNIKQTYLSYDEYKDDDYWICMYSFTRFGGEAIYSQPIDNRVYAYQPEQPETLKCYEFDFGARNVPNEHKKEIEKHLAEFEHYTLLKSPVVVTTDYIAGTLLNALQTQFFVYDIKNGISYEGEKTEQYDDSYLIGYDEPYIISTISPLLEVEEGLYPDSVKNHLLQEGQVIVLRPLNKSAGSSRTASN